MFAYGKVFINKVTNNNILEKQEYFVLNKKQSNKFFADKLFLFDLSDNILKSSNDSVV